MTMSERYGGGLIRSRCRRALCDQSVEFGEEFGEYLFVAEIARASFGQDRERGAIACPADLSGAMKKTSWSVETEIPGKAGIPTTVVRVCNARIGKQALERRQCQVTRPHRRKISPLR